MPGDAPWKRAAKAALRYSACGRKLMWEQGASAKAEERQNRNHDNDQTDDVDDGIHGGLLCL